MKKLMLLLILSLCVVACGSDEPAVIDNTSDTIELAALPDVIEPETAAALQDNDDVVLIDVREQWEYDAGHIPGITLIPTSEFAERVSEIPADKTIILACQSGVRSGRAQAYLQQLGYENVHNLRGGFVAWEAAGLPVE